MENPINMDDGMGYLHFRKPPDDLQMLKNLGHSWANITEVGTYGQHSRSTSHLVDTHHQG